MEAFKEIKEDIEHIMLKSISKVDPIHSKLALKRVLELKPDADPILQIAAIGHDIDRCFEERRIKREDFENYDEYKHQHALMSAKILSEILKKHGVGKKLIQKAKYLVEHHEVGGKWDAETLKEADSLSFFEHSLPNYIKTHTRKQTQDKIRFMYTRLSSKAKELVHKIVGKDKDIEELFKSSI
jgi:hypothetical protein